MSKWERSQLYESTYDGTSWHIPYSEDYWLEFMDIDEVDAPALEVGCGATGIWRYNLNVLGLDPIDFSNLGPNFVQGKAEEIVCPDKKFNDVYCINALDHMEDPALAMSELARVCKNRLVVWNYVFPDPTIYGAFYAPHPHTFTKQQLIDLMPGNFRIEMSADKEMTHEFLKYSPSFTSSLKLKVANALGVRCILLHLRRKQ